MDRADLQQALKTLTHRAWAVITMARGLYALTGACLVSALLLWWAKAGGGLSPWSALAPLAVFPLVLLLLALHSRPTILAAAKTADDRGGYKAVLATAAEILQTPTASSLAEAVVADAASAAATLKPRRLFPWRIPRTSWALPLLIALGCWIWTWPPPHTVLVPPEDAKAIQESARQIEILAQRVENPMIPRGLTLEQRRQAAQLLHQLARTLQEPGTTKAEAMAKINSLSEQLQRQAADTGRAGGAQAAGSSASGANGSKASGSNTAAAQALRNLAQRLQHAPLSEEQRKALAEQLRRQANQQPPNSPLRKSLEEAAKQLEQGRQSAAAKALNNAGRQLAQNQQNQPGQQGQPSQGSQSGQQGQGEQEIQSGSQGRKGQSGQTGAGQGQQGQGGDDLQNLADALSQQRQEMAGLASPTPGALKHGTGLAAPDYGRGATNKQQAGRVIKPKNYIFNRQQGGNGPGKRSVFQKYYASQQIQRPTATGRVHGQLGSGAAAGGAAVKGAPQTGGSAQAAPNEVYLQSKSQAEEAITRGQIPSQYQEMVKGYFNDIDPGKE